MYLKAGTSTEDPKAWCLGTPYLFGYPKWNPYFASQHSKGVWHKSYVWFGSYQIWVPACESIKCVESNGTCLMLFDVGQEHRHRAVKAWHRRRSPSISCEHLVCALFYMCKCSYVCCSPWKWVCWNFMNFYMLWAPAQQTRCSRLRSDTLFK